MVDCIIKVIVDVGKIIFVEGVGELDFGCSGQQYCYYLWLELYGQQVNQGVGLGYDLVDQWEIVCGMLQLVWLEVYLVWDRKLCEELQCCEEQVQLVQWIVVVG